MLPDTLYAATGKPKTSTRGPLSPGQDADMPWDTLKVVAFRIDPCSAHVGPVTNASTCKNELRVIFQNVRLDTSSGQADAVDGAVHAFYSLTRAELVELVNAMIALRRAEKGDAKLGALAVNPMLKEQGLLGNVGKAMKALILKYAGKANLTRFTLMSPATLATSWTFTGFDVSGATATMMTIPALDGSSIVTFFAGFGPDLGGTFTPSTTSHDDVGLLANLDNARSATKAARQAAFDAALRIENPMKHSSDTIDCASCHVAGPARIRTGGSLGLSAAGNPNAFTPDRSFVSDAEMAQTTAHVGDNRLNFHAFSYRHFDPMISQRVINETASVVTYLNRDVLRPAR